MIYVNRDGLAAIAPDVRILADKEGLTAHRYSVDVRLEDPSADAAADVRGADREPSTACTIRPAVPTTPRRSRTWSASWRSTRSSRRSRGRRPTTSAPTCSGLGPSPRRSWPRSTARPVGFALFFPTFSTFRGQPGLYLEDLFVRPEHRGRGIGKALLATRGQARRRPRLRPARMVGARLERAGDRLLPRARGRPARRVDRLPDRRRGRSPGSPAGARPVTPTPETTAG